MPPGIPPVDEAPSTRQSHGASWLHLDQHQPVLRRCQGLVYQHKMRARAPQRQWTRLTVKALIAVTVTLAISLAPLAASAQQAAPSETAQRPAWDTSEQLPPAWDKALRVLGDDTLYLLTSPLRLTPESALILGCGRAGPAAPSPRAP